MRRLHGVTQRDAGRTARVAAGADKADGARRGGDVLLSARALDALALPAVSGTANGRVYPAHPVLIHGGHRDAGQDGLPARRLAARLLAALLLTTGELARLELTAKGLAAGLLTSRLPARLLPGDDGLRRGGRWRGGRLFGAGGPAGAASRAGSRRT